MQSRIIHSSYVIGLVESGFPESEINQVIKPELDTYLENSENTESLQDWTLEILIVYNNVADLLLYRKNRSYPNEKYKAVVIHIPIPTNETIKWGVEADQHIDNNWDYRNSKYVDVLNIDPVKYNDISTYIIDALRLAIRECFSLGVTVNKKRILGHK